MKMGEAMYKAQQATGAETNAAGSAEEGKKADEEVVDADYEEVKK